MKAEKKDRNERLDGLRFIFSIMIVLYHLNKFVGNSVYFAKGWYIAIEFFSIVSGVFLMKSMEREQDVTCVFLKKLKNVYPIYISSYFLAFIITQIGKHMKWKESIRILLHSIGKICLFEMTGIDILEGFALQGSWYISAMLIGVLIVLCIYVISGRWFSYVVAPFLVFLFFGYFNQTYGKIHQTHDWLLFIYSGTIRVTAEMLLGCICYKVGQERKKTGKKYKNILSMIEQICYAIVIFSSYFYSRTGYDFIYIVLLAIAVTITISYDSEEENSKYIHIIGEIGKKFSLPIYLNHLWLIYIIKGFHFCITGKVVLFIFSLVISCLLVCFLDSMIQNGIQNYLLYREKVLLKEREKELIS